MKAKTASQKPQRRKSGWFFDVMDGCLRNPRLSSDLTRMAKDIDLAVRPVQCLRKDLFVSDELEIDYVLFCALLAQRALLHTKAPKTQYRLGAGLQTARRPTICGWQPIRRAQKAASR